MMFRKKSTTPCSSFVAGWYLAMPLASKRRDVDVHADARFHHVDDHQTDHQRERRDDLEIDQRAHADATDLLHVAHLRDAEHHGAENDRREQHLDELDERIGERLERDGYVGEHDPDERTDGDADQYLDI